MRLIVALLLTTVALTASACTDSVNSGPDRIASSMSATVDERGVVMTSVTYDRVELKYFVSGTTSVDPPNENIILSFDSLTAPGLIPILPTSTRVTVRYRRRTSATSVEEYKGISGSVKVEEIADGHATGTFSFRGQLFGGTQIVSVTEGTFSTAFR